MIGRTVVMVASLLFPSGEAQSSTAAGGAATANAAAAADVRELLREARGVQPALCAMAAEGASNSGWFGHGWGAPVMPIAADARVRFGSAESGRTRLTSEESAALLEGLGADDACVRQLSITLLGRAGNQNRGGRTADSALLTALTQRLTTGTTAERSGAAAVAGMMQARTITGPLLSALRDSADAVRANAAWALGRVSERSDRHEPVGTPVTAALARLVNDRSADVRAAAIVSLGWLRAGDDVDVLLRVLKDDTSAEVRRVAAWALGQLGAHAAEQGLGTALAQDKSDAVREMSAWALAELGARGTSTDLLIAALRGKQSSEVRETAAWALAEIGDRKAVDALAEAVGGDTDPEVRGTAAWALGQLARGGTAPASLIKAIRDQDDDVRLKAAWALSQIGDPNAIPAVTEALNTEQREQVREAEIRALLEGGAKSESALRGMVESKDAHTRELAVRALSGHRGPWPWPWPWPRPRPMP